MFTLKFYGDESADETKARVFAVAGVFGTEAEWGIAMREWLRCTRGRKFHAKDCESNHGKSSEQHAADLDLYKRLTISLSQSHIVGMAITLNLTSLNRHFSDLPPETAYCKCFTDLLRHTGQMAKRQQGEERDAVFEYVFDSRGETDGTASQIYQSFCGLPEWRSTSIFDATITFEGGDEPRLEMADLLAREAMKDLDRRITGIPRKRRASYETLMNAELGGAKKFIFIEYGDEYCARWREMVDSAQGRSDRALYERWLIDSGCVQNGHVHDTIANRARFYSWLENREALTKKT